VGEISGFILLHALLQLFLYRSFKLNDEHTYLCPLFLNGKLSNQAEAKV